MKKIVWVMIILAWGLVRTQADVAPPEVEPVSSGPMVALELDLTCVLPTNGPAVEHGVLVARLQEYDPRLADEAATEISRVVLSGISHRAGEETVLRFPCAGETPVRKAYYLTAVVYPQGAATDRAGLYFIDGFQHVLATGDRESLNVTLTPVGAETMGEPTN